MRLCILILVTTGLFVGAGGAGDGKSDHEKIQGAWKILSVEDGGRKQPEARVMNAQIVITRDQFTLREKGKKDEVGTYRLDPTKKPKWFDLETRKENVLRGIYELNGDRLRICFNEKRNGERSTAFVSRPNSPNDVLLILQRVKR